MEGIVILVVAFTAFFVLMAGIPYLLGARRGRKWIDTGTIDEQKFNRSLARLGSSGYHSSTLEQQQPDNPDFVTRIVQLIGKKTAAKMHQSYTSDQEHATRLVKGIAGLNPVVFFMSGTPETKKNPNVLLVLDIFKELGVDVRTVDLDTDETMQMGLPTHGDAPIIPYLFIDSMRVGGVMNVLEMAQNGDLAKRLDAANIIYDKEVAAQLRPATS